MAATARFRNGGTSMAASGSRSMNTLQHWLARFDSLSLRERLLVLAAALVVVTVKSSVAGVLAVDAVAALVLLAVMLARAIPASTGSAWRRST